MELSCTCRLQLLSLLSILVDENKGKNAAFIGWPVGRLLNVKSKGDFINYMLVEQLVDKRLQLLQNLREGLNYFGLLKLMTKSPQLWKQLFVTENSAPLTADVFMDLVQPPTSLDEMQAKAYGLFVTFVMDHMEMYW